VRKNTPLKPLYERMFSIFLPHYKIDYQMESLDILEKLGKVAGIAGIAVGALVLIFSGIIQKNIFPNLSKEHGFRVIRMIIIAASAIAVIGIAAWIFSDLQKNKKEKAASLVGRVIEGFVTDANGRPVVSTKVSIAQLEDISDRSDVDGKYHLEIEGTGKKYYDLVFSHPQYTIVRKKITIDFNDNTDEIQFGQVVLSTLLPPDPEIVPLNQNENHSNTENGRQAPVDNNNRQTNNSNGVDITVTYLPEDHYCKLNLIINIGGISYNPQTNPVTLLNVPRGKQRYAITGNTSCNNCQIMTLTPDLIQIMAGGDAATANMLKFFTEINVVSGVDYYLVFDPETCLAGILDQKTYNTFKALSY